jgi:hypothetical protein
MIASLLFVVEGDQSHVYLLRHDDFDQMNVILMFHPMKLTTDDHF